MCWYKPRKTDRQLDTYTREERQIDSYDATPLGRLVIFGV